MSALSIAQHDSLWNSYDTNITHSSVTHHYISFSTSMYSDHQDEMFSFLLGELKVGLFGVLGMLPNACICYKLGVGHFCFVTKIDGSGCWILHTRKLQNKLENTF